MFPAKPRPSPGAAFGDDDVAEIQALGRRAVARPFDVARIDTFSAFAASLAAALEATWRRTTFDFLINNAGIDRKAPFAQTTEAAFDELMAVHFKGGFSSRRRCCRCSPTADAS